MAGETRRAEAICLDIRPWSRTSHVVTWLTGGGPLATVVKGAVRPKSPFLGQYDLNYTCDILYYARATGGLHALRDCLPVRLREGLRGSYRALAVAGYCRRLVGDLAPSGPDGQAWLRLLAQVLDVLAAAPARSRLLPLLVRFELDVLRLSGLQPDFSGYDREAAWSAFSLEAGSYTAAAGRCVRVPQEVAAYLAHPHATGNSQVPLDAARVIGVFYKAHLDCASDVRRSVLGMIS